MAMTKDFNKEIQKLRKKLQHERAKADKWSKRAKILNNEQLMLMLKIRSLEKNIAELKPQNATDEFIHLEWRE